jgi:hypothetical protein
MTAYPGQPPSFGQPAPAKKTLIWIAIACFVIGAVVAGFFVWRIVETAPRSPQSIAGGTVHLKREGLTIYSSVPVPGPPCDAKDPSGADVPLTRQTSSEVLTINGDTWYVVARSVSAVPAGDYSVSCIDSETSASYAAGPRTSLAGFVGSIFGAIGALVIFGILGTVLLVIGIVRARRKPMPGPFPPQPGAPGNYPY